MLKPVLGGVVIALVLRAILLQFYVVESGSMAPTLQAGDRLVVWKLARLMEVSRGDIVIVDGTDSLAGAVAPDSLLEASLRIFGFERLDNRLFVKRVIAIAGDRLVCCDKAGALLLNGAPLIETYLGADEVPSRTTFDVTVPTGSVWLMGDARATSRDSRDLLGRPGGGMISADMIVGRVALVAWPPARMRTVD